ncbi:hypothetical protein CAPTEDRAFT_206322 [Capitella teleta]|uniref:Alpha-2-macroglobulin bait region domain-containing protein n=1 Tax=Capitella teleta TaxID=283909 RepID=R7UVR6_CAPTE|nr:hypothetical protein CAPTEDRAFT_206322 [Capitella teleta]|eukprot:ELU10419.1 hypothetical protein CAPTEDRAFT_206322 [Capitella teleta]
MRGLRMQQQGNMQLLSKGGIVYSSYHDTGVSATKHTVAIPVSPELAHDLAPSARINIWYLTSTGEIITDSLELKVEGAFLNEVLADLKKYDSSKKHGGYIPMPMFRGGMMDKRSIWWPLPSGGSDSSEIFENSGLVVFTDALVYAEPVEASRYPMMRGAARAGGGERGGIAAEADMAMDGAFDAEPSSKASSNGDDARWLK